MSKYFFVLFLALSLFFISCSSLNADAEEAVDLIARSLEYTRDGNLKKADALYREYLEIEQKYRGTEDYKAFKEAYNKYYSEKFSLKDEK